MLSESVPLHYITYFLMSDVISPEHPLLFKAHKKQLKRGKKDKTLQTIWCQLGCLSNTARGNGADKSAVGFGL